MQGRRRRIRLSAYAAVAALLLFALAVAVTGFLTHRHLRDAQVAVGQLRSAMVRQDTPPAEVDRHLRTLQREADAARSLTDGPLWGVPAAVPWVGRPFETVRGASAAVSRVAHDVLPPVRQARSGLVGVSLANPKGGVDLRPVVAAQEPLGRAHDATEAVLADVRRLPTTGLGPVDGARRDLLAQLDALGRQLSSAHDLVTLLPPMLGSQEPRRYLVAFQNNAEARGAGGLPGVYAVLRADHGKLDFEHYGVTGDFNGITVSLKGLSPGYADLYRPASPHRFVGNTTISPHFPDGATLLLRYWKAKSGQQLDGVLALDPPALSKMLAVTGPAKLPDGSQVSSSNVVALTERDAYERFDDQEQRKMFLVSIAQAVADVLLERGPQKGTAFATALAQSVDERRLLVYSTHRDEQTVLANRKVGGTLSDTSGLYSGVVVNNGGGNKLDYYLERDVTYEGPCPTSGGRDATVTIRLTNRAPKSGLSDYVAGRADHPQPALPKGTNRVLLSYYATKGAGFTAASLDGKDIFLSSGTEQGRPVFGTALEIKPGQTRVLTLTIDEPAEAKGPVTTLVQPLVLPQQTVVRSACAAAGAP